MCVCVFFLRQQFSRHCREDTASTPFGWSSHWRGARAAVSVWLARSCFTPPLEEHSNLEWKEQQRKELKISTYLQCICYNVIKHLMCQSGEDELEVWKHAQQCLCAQRDQLGRRLWRTSWYQSAPRSVRGGPVCVSVLLREGLQGFLHTRTCFGLVCSGFRLGAHSWSHTTAEAQDEAGGDSSWLCSAGLEVTAPDSVSARGLEWSDVVQDGGHSLRTSRSRDCLICPSRRRQSLTLTWFHSVFLLDYQTFILFLRDYSNDVVSLVEMRTQ